MLRLKSLEIVPDRASLAQIPVGKVLINTINAHSYNTAQKDALFAESLTPNPAPIGEGSGDGCVRYLIPDGASIVKVCRWLKAASQPTERIAGWDLFCFEMDRLNRESEKFLDKPSGKAGRKVENDSSSACLRVMFMGSSERVLSLICEKAATEYPNLEVVTYSPPYKPKFSDADNQAIIEAINQANPDLLWIGMTAPKQEKWAYGHWDELNIHCHVGTIGAVFDFFAGTAKRAPQWWQDHSLEWLYRLVTEPKRMWRRYVIGNPLFLWNILKEKMSSL